VDVYDLDEDVIPNNTAIQVEVVASGKGGHSSVHGHTAALLNMRPASSLREQARSGRLTVQLLKVNKWDGKDVRYMPPDEERELRERLVKDSNGVLHVPAIQYTPDGALSLWEREKRMGREGIVLRHRTDPELPFIKMKNKETWDFPITGIGPVQPKHSTNARTHKELTATRNPGSKWMRDGKPVGAGYVTYDANTGYEAGWLRP
jgi:ATP-dependent DNA ligase